jgi:threonine synthase
MKYESKCSVCDRLSGNLLTYKCPSCGNPLELQLHVNFEPERIHRDDYSVWRYAHFFPYVDKNNIISLGEGWTPLLKFSHNTYFKLEGSNPTGSFKDRGSTVLVSAIHKLVKSARGFISEDSSGNAGASIAAYAARAGLKAEIYVPETVSGPKFNQIRFYRAKVAKISGSRSKVAEKAERTVKGKFYVGHILHPLFRDGMRSLAYEIAEQFGWHISERIYVPVSAGTLLLGLINGFGHLAGSGVIKSVPKIVACQTRQVSPLYHRLMNLEYIPPAKITSIADALVSVKPPLLEIMVKSLKSVNGDAVMVEEDEILKSFKELADNAFFVEPSSAVAYAAYVKQLRNGQVSKEESVTIVLTGNGLKTTLEPN